MIVLKLALRLQDMFILLALCLVFLGIVYLIDRIRDELREGSFHASNYSPWQMPELSMFVTMAIIGSGTLLSGSVDAADLGSRLASKVSMPLTAYFFVAGLVYFLSRRLRLVKGITALHLVLTFGALLVFVYNIGFVDSPLSIHEGSIQSTSNVPIRIGSANPLMVVATLTFIGAQFLLFLNVLIGLIRKQTH